MEKIIFTIHHCNDDMCRIVAKNIKTDIRKLSDEACICDMDGLLDEMERIKADAEAIGYEVLFEIEDFRNF